MKEYQHLIGKIIVAVAIIVAAIIIAQAIGGAGESIRSGLLQLGDALRQLPVCKDKRVLIGKLRAGHARPLRCGCA